MNNVLSVDELSSNDRILTHDGRLTHLKLTLYYCMNYFKNVIYLVIIVDVICQNC